jgi:hypothetical protein
MIVMTNEEVLLHIKKIVDKWDQKFAEETQGNMVLEMRRDMWMWKECIDEIRPLLKEIK